MLPEAWQYPEIAAARIEYRGRTYTSAGYRETPWTQLADFRSSSGESGSIAIVYLDRTPEADEGPFLSEERDLIDSLAEMLRAHLERQLAEEELRATRDALEAQVIERTADLRRLASRLTLAEQRERRRIASDLHDHVGQSLAFIKLRVRDFQGNAVFGGFEDALDEIVSLLDQTIAYTRELTGDISPPVLYELGLEPALEWLAERFTAKRGFAVSFRVEGEAVTVKEEIAVLMFTSARELLSNCQQHSGAPEADMTLRWLENTLALTVADSGRGFDAVTPLARSGDGQGLFGIRERIGDLGGEVDIYTGHDLGCRVVLQVPLTTDDTP
jgi:signal transduction histidine kinase